MTQQDKKEAISIARDIILRLAKDKFGLKDEISLIFALNEDRTGETTLFYLKDIKKLIEELINKIEEK